MHGEADIISAEPNMLVQSQAAVHQACRLEGLQQASWEKPWGQSQRQYPKLYDLQSVPQCRKYVICSLARRGEALPGKSRSNKGWDVKERRLGSTR